MHPYMSIKRFYLSKSKDCFCFYYYIRHRGTKILLKYGFTRDLCSGINNKLYHRSLKFPNFRMSCKTKLTETKKDPAAWRGCSCYSIGFSLFLSSVTNFTILSKMLCTRARKASSERKNFNHFGKY